MHILFVGFHKYSVSVSVFCPGFLHLRLSLVQKETAGKTESTEGSLW